MRRLSTPHWKVHPTMQIDPLTIGMLAILALLIVFMFRSSRKRKRTAEELQAKVTEGADVMTNFGLYGKIITIDPEENKIALEVSPGNIVTVHRQTVTRVIEAPVVEDDVDAVSETHAAPELNTDHAIRDTAPEFGERIDGSSKSDKKVDE
jgi:preprotein translocase subunit YajC